MGAGGCWIHKPFLATTSASIIGHPSSRSMEDTVLFPEEIPPVSPTRNILRQHRGEKMNVQDLLEEWY